jgi:hypothetical protein
LNVTGILSAASTIDLAAGVNIVNINLANALVTAVDIASTGSTTNVLNLNAVVTGAALTLQASMDIFGTVNSTVNQGVANTVTINNAATIVTATGGSFVLGTGGDTFTSSGTSANIVTGAAGADTITFANTLGNTASGAGGIDTIGFSAANGVADTIGFNDGAGTVGIVAAVNRDVVNGFATVNDVIRLDQEQTTVALSLQSVGTNAAVTTGTGVSSVLALSFDIGGAANVLGGILNGSGLLANTGAITVTAGDDGYIIAYDAGNAYLYSYVEANDTNLDAGEIALIGTFNSVAVGGIGIANLAEAA